MKIAEDVMKVLASAQSKGNTVTFHGQLERKLYVKINEVMEAAGFTWSRKAKCHVHGDVEADAEAIVDRLVATGEVESASDLGFFETPVPLARQLVEMAGVKPGMVALEPSAGRGRIVDALIQAGASLVTVVERSEERRDHLLNKMSEGLPLEVVMSDDFMDMEAEDEFDVVVMNPPFAKVGKGNHLDHVRHAFSMLKAGGCLVSVLPSGVTFREDKKHKEFRDWVASCSGMICDLPEKSFHESGTDVNTVVLVMRKP